MASNSETSLNLTNHQYVRLGQVISGSNMESIAFIYMNIDEEKIKKLKSERRDDKEGFVRDVIKEWACRHPHNQVQKLAVLLYTAAKQAGYVDPEKIEEILKVPSSLVSEVTVDELETIADDMRPYTADAMKIEVAPWIKDYVVDMDDLYTELTLENTHKTATDEDKETLNNYSQLFENPSLLRHSEKASKTDRRDSPEFQSQFQSMSPKRLRLDHNTASSVNTGDKILIKADPGMGKTSLCKKINLDWANRLFTYFRIVFFTLLQLVKPGDSIETTIIKQHPYMKGLQISEKKIQNILELYGGECLLILDGLDEHALGTNKDVLSVIKGKKYLQCNIIVTSRPHNTRQIEEYFPTVVGVEGFTRNKAKEFASKILNDTKTIEAILNYNPTDVKKQSVLKLKNAGKSIHKCPILLSFMCLLVREDDIDLSNTQMHTGEIYARMVKCLYKKYVIRRGLSFNNDQFTATMTSIGKLAFKTLLSGDPLLRRTDVIREVGEEAFDYGLLIGHEDFSLIQDHTENIFVSFPHRSIQEFLGALYFIFMLVQGVELQSLLGVNCDKPIFLTNTLFLQFCLWFLHDEQVVFCFENRRRVHQYLVQFSLGLINCKVLDMKIVASNYPALDIASIFIAKDDFRFNFLADILVKCNKTSSLISPSTSGLGYVLHLIDPILKAVSFIQHGKEIYHITYVKGKEIVIKASNSASDDLNVILKHYTKLINKPTVHLYLQSPWCNFEKVSHQGVKMLYLTRHTDRKKIFDKKLRISSHLTHFFLQEIRNKAIVIKEINQLSKAAKKGNSLSHLNLIDCDFMEGKLPVLFKSEWPHLKHLSLLETQLSETDLEFLCLTCNGPEKTLPNLTSLCLSFSGGIPTENVYSKLFTLPWLNLKQFYVDDKFDSSICSLTRAKRDDKLPNLSYLIMRTSGKRQKAMEHLCLDQFTNLQYLFLNNCIPHRQFQNVVNTLTLCELGISSINSLMGNLSSLLLHDFPKLKNLTLSNCTLKPQDVLSLAQANATGRLPLLKYLDISMNKLPLPDFKYMFSEPWNGLVTLDITRTFGDGEDNEVMGYLNEIASHGYLPSLQKLGIDQFKTGNTHWNKLEKLFLTNCSDDALHNIADAVYWGYLPVLQTLCLERFEGYNADIVRTLSQLGLVCHETCVPLGNEFSHEKCICET